MSKILDKLKYILKSKIAENLYSLSIIQVSNYLIPLFAVPYLLRVIGIEKFGTLIFFQALIQYFYLLVEFGFNFSGTKEISIISDNKKEVSKIGISIIFARIILALISFALLFVFVSFNDKLYNNYKLVIYFSGLIVSNIFLSQWLFHGLQKLKAYSLSILVSKILFLILIFVFIKNEADYYYYAIFFSGTSILNAIIAIFLGRKYIKYDIRLVSYADIITQIKISFDYFLINISSTLYLSVNPIILGFLFNDKIVGYYAVAEKTVRGIRYLFNPITQSIFPKFSKDFSKQKYDESLHSVDKFAIIVLPLLVLTYIILYLFSHEIVKLLNGAINAKIIINIRIIGIIIIVGTLNQIYGILGMINLNRENIFRNIISLCGMLNVVLCYVLSNYLQDMGAAISVVVTELLILILLYIFTRYNI